MVASLEQRYESKLHGVLSCFDRLVVTGTLPGACYAAGMTSYLKAKGIRIFDYARFAEPLRERIRQAAQTEAERAGIEIEHVSKSHIRKEDLVARVLAQRGDAPGLVHIISAMEACQSYKPWHDKASGQTFLKPDSGKCLHYYFYFIDRELGLCYLRVPTWCPFRLQFYCNGHSALARALDRQGIGYAIQDNAFLRIDDVAQAQALADTFNPALLHRCLDRYAKRYCPVAEVFVQHYHWSVMQVEFSTDLMFKSADTLGPLYDALSRQAVLAVHAEQVAMFLGKKITPQLAQEVGSRLSTRIEGRCIKHRIGAASVKVYDKFARVLRVETTVNDISFFRHHRTVEHRDGHDTMQLAAMKKSIHSLPALRTLLLGCNQRYLAFLASLDDPSSGSRDLARLSNPKPAEQCPAPKPVNFFSRIDQRVLRAVQRPEFNIQGLRRADLAKHVPELSASALSRKLLWLRQHHLIKKVAHTYRYYITRIGRAAIAAACSLTEFNIIPAMAHVR